MRTSLSTISSHEQHRNCLPCTKNYESAAVLWLLDMRATNPGDVVSVAACRRVHSGVWCTCKYACCKVALLATFPARNGSATWQANSRLLAGLVKNAHGCSTWSACSVLAELQALHGQHVCGCNGLTGNAWYQGCFNSHVCMHPQRTASAFCCTVNHTLSTHWHAPLP